MLECTYLKHGLKTEGTSTLKTSSAKQKELSIKTPAKFKTHYDNFGRVCTKCLEYKEWGNFFVAKKTASGHQSECKKCKVEKRKTNRNYTKEKYSAKKNKQKVKKENPILFKARQLRSSLLSRSKDPEIKKGTPTVQELEAWLTREKHYCHYSGIQLTIEKITVDHKTPVSRGGNNSLENLCIASHHMNTAKGKMNEKEFFQLLKLVSKWEDKGESILKRLKQGWF